MFVCLFVHSFIHYSFIRISIYLSFVFARTCTNCFAQILWSVVRYLHHVFNHSSIPPSIYIDPPTSIHTSVHPSIHLSFHPPIHPSTCVCIHPFILPFIHQSIHPFIHNISRTRTSWSVRVLWECCRVSAWRSLLLSWCWLSRRLSWTCHPTWGRLLLMGFPNYTGSRWSLAFGFHFA